MAMEPIYFDNGSTSFPKAPGVADAVSDLLAGGAFNINRGSYGGAYAVAGKVLDTRAMLARLFHAPDSKCVIFTPGITWSFHYFIKGFLSPGDHVLVSGMEHNAVMRPLHQMARQGVAFDMVHTNQDGTIDPEDVEAAVRPNTRAVMMLHASNVCGTVVPIREIGDICMRRHLFFAVDTAQTAGTLDVDMTGCHIDFLGFTGHKGLLGPQGIGGFLISQALDAQMPPFVAGGTGSQSDSLDMPSNLPDKYESGTLNLPGIIGLHAALSYLESTGVDNLHKKKLELTSYFLNRVKELSGIRIIGRQEAESRTSVVSLDFPEHDNACIAFDLEQQCGVMTRVGLHCAPMAHRTFGTFPQGTVRFSFSACNTLEEIDCCADGIRSLLKL